MTMQNDQRVWPVAAARFATLLGLGVWLGGIAFAGAVAPLLFRVARENGVEAVAPQMFGAMLARFGFITLVCAVLMLGGWLAEAKASRAPLSLWPQRARKLWMIQGVLTLSMLAVAIYLSIALLPRMNVLQREFLPQFRQGAMSQPLIGRDLTIPKLDNSAPRQEFERGHVNSTRLTMLCFWLGVATLACFSARSILPRANAGADLLHTTPGQTPEVATRL